MRNGIKSDIIFLYSICLYNDANFFQLLFYEFQIIKIKQIIFFCILTTCFWCQWLKQIFQNSFLHFCFVIETIYFMFNTKKGENEEGQLDVCFVVVHFCNIYVSYTLFSCVMLRNVLFANAYFFLYTFLSAISN